MRVLVQNTFNLEYLRPRKGWTRNHLRALDFEKTARAIEYCVRQRIADAQLVLRFGEDRQLDIVLPIRISGFSSVAESRLSAA